MSNSTLHDQFSPSCELCQIQGKTTKLQFTPVFLDKLRMPFKSQGFCSCDHPTPTYYPQAGLRDVDIAQDWLPQTTFRACWLEARRKEILTPNEKPWTIYIYNCVPRQVTIIQKNLGNTELRCGFRRRNRRHTLRPSPRYPQRSRWYCDASPGWQDWSNWKRDICVCCVFTFKLQYVLYKIMRCCRCLSKTCSSTLYDLHVFYTNNITIHIGWVNLFHFIPSFSTHFKGFSSQHPDWMPHDEAMKRLWLQLHFSAENSDETSKRTKGVLPAGQSGAFFFRKSEEKVVGWLWCWRWNPL